VKNLFKISIILLPFYQLKAQSSSVNPSIKTPKADYLQSMGIEAK
jgi:hypothetical protein